MSKEINHKISTMVKLYRAINPNIVTTKKNVLYFNADNDDNSYPQKLIDLYINASSTHSNFINLKRNMLYGTSGLQPVVPSVEWDNFSKKTNKAGDTLNDVFLKNCFDMAIFEAFALLEIYNSDNEITNIYHVDVSTLRAEKPDEFGRINNWYVSQDWGSISNRANRRSSVSNKATSIAAYNPSKGTEDGLQILYGKRYVAGSTAYSIPSYNSATNWIQLDHELSKFELNKVASGFFPTLILYLNGDPDDEAKDKFANNFERSYLGADGKKVMYIYGTDADERPQIIRLEEDTNNTLFDQLNEISAQKIATAHGGSLELAGIDSKGVSLGGDANKLNVGLAFYQKNVIKPMQEVLIENYNKILSHNGIGDVEIIYSPLKVEIEGDTVDTPTPEDKVIEQELIRELNK